uniref:Late endosomal/lysosomal adaptor and MAPK and MTOR activator 4 n=1 Tax=Culicoides sonorensis TaxID=179676 RepID=A0A336K187_CULSO
MLDLDKIENSTGYLVLNEEGAVLSSHGDLQNDEKTANIVFGLVSLVDTVDPAVFPKHGCQKIAIVFDEFSYTICQSNKKIYVVKRWTNGNGGDLIDIGS